MNLSHNDWQEVKEDFYNIWEFFKHAPKVSVQRFKSPDDPSQQITVLPTDTPKLDYNSFMLHAAMIEAVIVSVRHFQLNCKKVGV